MFTQIQIITKQLILSKILIYKILTTAATSQLSFTNYTAEMFYSKNSACNINTKIK